MREERNGCANPFAQPFLQSDDGRDIGKINLLNNDLNAMLLAEGFSESLQPVQAARDQDQRMALLGILAGELLAEAARCARDKDPRIVCCHHFIPLFTERRRSRC